MTPRASARSRLVAPLLLHLGCTADDGEGVLRITAYGESYIEQRIPAADTIDGWEVVFSRFVVGLGRIDVDGTPLDETFVVDLATPSGGEGHLLTEVAVPAGTVDTLGYHVVVPEPDATRVATDDAGLATLRDGEYRMFVEGTATHPTAGSKTFAWGFTVDGHYEGCETMQRVDDGGTATSQITIHADHLLYDDLDSETPNVAFDLVASADTDGDGAVTTAELAAVDLTTLERYQVGSRDITDLWSFIEAQSRTVGHIDGEGHCGG